MPESSFDLHKRELQSLEIIESVPSDSFEDVVKLATILCQTPVAALAFVHKDRLCFKAKVGFPLNDMAMAESLCSLTLERKETVVIPDARVEQRAKNNPFVVNEPYVRFYCGIPLKTQDGIFLGTLSVADFKPRSLMESQILGLEALARQAMAQLHLRNLERLEKKAREELDLIVRALPDIIFRFDRDGKFIFFHTNEPDKLFAPPEFFLGKKTNEVLPASVASQFNAACEALKETNVTQSFVYELNLGRTSENFEARVVSASNKEIIVIVRNITDKVKTLQRMLQSEADLALERERLVANSKMSALGEMAGGIAHEINTPLAIISGKSRMLRKKLNETAFSRESASKDLTDIESTVERIAKIIRGLQAFSRNAHADPMQKVKIKSVIDDTISLCGERFRNNGVTLEIVCETEELVECREAQIVQVIMNLLSNAFDAVHSLPEKWVELRAETVGNKFRVTVIDSGTTIQENVLEKMMQPFFTTKEVGKGTGLGLSISLGILKDHQGEMWYDGTHQNTRFVFEIPLRQSPKVPS